FGDDVKVAGGIGDRRTADVVGQSEIERVLPRGRQSHELDRGGMLQKFLDQGYVELGVFGTEEKGDARRLTLDDRVIDLVDVLEVHKDIVRGGGERSIGGVHKVWCDQTRPEQSARLVRPSLSVRIEWVGKSPEHI